MHPNVFLKTFWRMELRPEVFVAMDFSPGRRTIYDEVIVPAVDNISVEGVPPLKAYRVDDSRSGDCILTEIIEGIAHAQLVLADVSTIGTDRESGRPHRNGNVIYEVGLALACRQSGEVLVVRDDADELIFDCSTVPTMTLDFGDKAGARAKLTHALQERLKARSLDLDARVGLAFRTLTTEAAELLRHIMSLPPGYGWGQPRSFEAPGGAMDIVLHWRSLDAAAAAQLLDNGLIRREGTRPDGNPVYAATDLGRVVGGLLQSEPGASPKDTPVGEPSQSGAGTQSGQA